jgi:predicted nucleic acid-binding protein
MRIYLDTCCFSRPLDDQEQLRVKLESQAILHIVKHAARGEWTIIGSDAVDTEIAAIRDIERRLAAEALAGYATERVDTGSERHYRGGMLERLGFGMYDSLHIACAEAAGADVLLTTDDALIRRARRLQHEVGVSVANPLTWLKERSE